jgi:uncharacterized phiE125 gp8 family phage protein
MTKRPRLQSVRIGEAAGPIVSLSELKGHLVVEHGEDDVLIGAMGRAAEQALTGIDTIWQRIWIEETWRDFWPNFQSRPLLRLAPVARLERVTYIDTTGAEVELPLAGFRIVQEAGGGRVIFQQGFSEPLNIAAIPDAVRLDYVAGYGPTADRVPEPVKQAVKLTVGHWYRYRDSVHINGQTARELPMTVSWLMAPFRRYGVEAWADLPSAGLPAGDPLGPAPPYDGPAPDGLEIDLP